MKFVKVLYYPGCTLKAYDTEFEQCGLESAKALGIEMVEIPNWVCCGVVHSLAEDDVIHHLGAARTICRAQPLGRELGVDTIVALCSMCYNVLKAVDNKLRNDESIRQTITFYMTDEEPYDGSLKIKHFLQFLKEDVGFDKIKQSVKNSLASVKVGAYYGCTLLRPKDVAIDDFEEPTILEEFIEAIGAVPIDFPMKKTCCGSYLSVVDKDILRVRAKRILSSAVDEGAIALVTFCPLCAYDLKKGQSQFIDGDPLKEIPILYATELLGKALGVKPAEHVLSVVCK